MSDPVESLASLTVHRDLDALDAALVHALADLLQPQAIALHRLVGLRQQPSHWTLSARLGPLVAWTGRPLPVRPFDDELPELAALPAHKACIDTGCVQHLTAEAGAAVTLFPLLSGRGPVAVLEVQSAQPLGEADVQMVSGILRVFQNFWNVVDESERDTLTGLLNRKTFDDTFFKISLALPRPPSALEAPAGGGCWLAVLDIDHFKSVNDRFGHLIGDEVLLLAARMLREMLRHHDRLYRFGGEEFVVLLRCGSEADARRALERVREGMANHAFPQVGHVTVSIGFAQVLPGDTPSSAFGRADKAVYHAKQHGRNRVVSYNDLVLLGQAGQEDARVGEVELF